MINNGDFVLINFVGRIKSSGKIFDLTKKEVAEQEGLSGENFTFKPVLVIPDSNYVLKAVASSLIGKNVDDKYTLEVKAEDAFGKFDPKLVKTVGLASFRQNGINPSVGDVIMLDNKIATVLSVNGGRVMISFNNPLAGKDLVYEIEIVKTIEDTKERCSYIFEHYVGKPPDELTLEVNVVSIRYKIDLKQYIIDAIIADINKYVGKELKTEFVKS
jgi:FKBP-type peptidyl-prolyl cis-trans isomerase 2